MASGSNSNPCVCPHHSRCLRKLRATLVKEMPEPNALLGDLEFSKQFSPAERVEVMKGHSQSKRADKLLDYLELKPAAVFAVFLRVLGGEDTRLAAKLTGELSETEGPSGSKCKLLIPR